MRVLMIHPDGTVLDWNISVPRDATKILVEPPWITLEGQVDFLFSERTRER